MAYAAETLHINDTAPSIIKNFKSFYGDIANLPLKKIEAIYDPNIVFRDPIHEVNGITNLHTYMAGICANVSSGRFEFLDQLTDDGTAYIKWEMHFTHPKMGKHTIVVRGVSHIKFGERIYFHEDVYDMGEMVYEHIPILGTATRWLKHRLTQQGNNPIKDSL